jgi:hypothetical protein
MKSEISMAASIASSQYGSSEEMTANDHEA